MLPVEMKWNRKETIGDCELHIDDLRYGWNDNYIDDSTNEDCLIFLVSIKQKYLRDISWLSATEGFSVLIDTLQQMVIIEKIQKFGPAE